MNAEHKKNSSLNWREVFAMDFRSLAIFRILLGLMLLADLLFRLPTLRAMYTDQGVMTRDVVYQYYAKYIGFNWQYGVWSFHWFSGDATLQYILFAVAGIAAIALALGWKTRIATIISWLLLASLHARNPLILTSGDTILKLTLFWSMFLPLGRIWSLDSKSTGAPDRPLATRYTSFASMGFILQIILMYFFTGVAKCNEDWFSGNAMEYVLRLDIYILPMGSELLKYPTLLTITTYATLFVEVIGIWFLLSPRRNDLARYLVMGAYWAFHIGIGMTMAIGLFPIICLVIWLPLIPTSFWSWISKSSQPASENQLESPRSSVLQIIGNAGMAFIILFTLLLNISNIETPEVCRKFLPRAIVPVGFWLNLDQRFQMFGRPPKSNPWFVYEATLKDKTQVDLMRPKSGASIDSTIDYDRPTNVRLSIPGHHWRKLHRNLVNPIRADFRQALVDYAVKNWNETHSEDKQVVLMRLICYNEAIGPDYDGIQVNSTVWGSFEAPDMSAGTKFDAMADKLLNEMGF